MNKYLIITLIFVLLVLTGCKDNSEDTPIADYDPYQGTGGLEIEFLTDSPPNEIYEGEQFQMVLNVINKGSYDINEGRIVLTYPEDDFEVGTKSFYLRLKGKDTFNNYDDQSIKSFYIKSKNLMNLSLTRDSLLAVTACYDYTTKLTADICIDTDPHNIKLTEKSCNQETTSFSGQGAPVSISRVEQKTLSSNKGIRPQFKIYIKNEGEGEVISKNAIGDICSGRRISKTDINGIKLNKIKFSKYTQSDMDCLPKELRLVNGEDYFVCTMKENNYIDKSRDSFSSSLYVELEYGYYFTESKSIIINKLNTFN